MRLRDLDEGAGGGGAWQKDGRRAGEVKPWERGCESETLQWNSIHRDPKVNEHRPSGAQDEVVNLRAMAFIELSDRNQLGRVIQIAQAETALEQTS